MLADRLRVAAGAAPYADVLLSPQAPLSCDTSNGGCRGGDPATLLRWLAGHGVPLESCMPYAATGHDSGARCIASGNCAACAAGPGACSPLANDTTVSVAEYGSVSGEAAMLKELQRGPIVCNIAVTDALLDYAGGILHDTTGGRSIDHSVNVVGYGEAGGVAYWVARNRCAGPAHPRRGGRW